jgi:hypothetical protein
VCTIGEPSRALCDTPPAALKTRAPRRSAARDGARSGGSALRDNPRISERFAIKAGSLRATPASQDHIGLTTPAAIRAAALCWARGAHRTPPIRREVRQ